MIGERRWNDYQQKVLKKGVFTEQEVKTLLNALCTYAKDQEDPLETLSLLCQSSVKNMPKE